MIRALAIVLAGLVIGCKGTAPVDPNDETPVSVTPTAPSDACCMAEPSTPPTEPAPATELVPPGEPVPTSHEPIDEATMTPASLYAQCRDRVELPEAAGECKTAADCTASGCGGEVCASTSHGAIMSTCEVRYCFQVLDSCGCVDGRCTWSVKAEIPEGRRMVPLE